MHACARRLLLMMRWMRSGLFIPPTSYGMQFDYVFKHREVEKPKRKKRAAPKELEYVHAY